jgi:hypothetical protein|nr:hypothetical protein [uncultured Mediterranean phage uvMED]|tara:strand:- start:1415 stop:1744 length:330 start_codon:yes stop_codon:yes gene_type:complete
MTNIVGLNGQKVKPKEPKEIYNLRVCLIGSDDIDIKRIETFGVAEDGFFMVKSLDNPKFPVFMTNPVRIRTLETYKEGTEPMTKLKSEKGDDDFLVDLLKAKNENQSKA